MKFRPCIDLHNGKVKQIVGSTLKDDDPSSLKENFVSDLSPSYYASLFKKDNFTGGHVIMLGKGNETAAEDAILAWKEGLQLGGGINDANAKFWLERGAAAVIVTSYVFNDGFIDWTNLDKIAAITGKQRLVLDLSCKKRDNKYYIVTNRWQVFTDVFLDRKLFSDLSDYCFEFLIHAVDVEGGCKGIDTELLSLLAEYSPIPVTYAGGIRDMNDIKIIQEKGKGKIDFTVGSALDIFGGSGIKYEDLVQWMKENG